MSQSFLLLIRCALEYDPDSGIFRWKIYRNSFGGQVVPGAVAGTDKDGYVQIGFDGRYYRAHHLAWLFMTGSFPDKGLELDHINCNRSDNRWANLRLVTRSMNVMNSPRRSDNRSGHRGVSFRKDTGKWHARICVDGKITLLGNFSTIESAVEARRIAEKEYFGAYAHAQEGRLA